MMAMEKDFNIFPEIMGILNVTPDSFSDGGNYFDKNFAVKHALALIQDGADIIDIGGESSRPSANPVSTKDEIKRIIPVIEKLKRLVPGCIISVDTTKYDVAAAALDAGAGIINDISGLQFDERLASLAAVKSAGLVIMHINGTPQTMQKNPVYNDVVQDVYDFLNSKVSIAAAAGVKNIYIDVGIGFGKTLKHNLALLKNIDVFTSIDAKILLGISRKSFLGTLTGINNPEERDTATVLFHALLLGNSINVIRVHDVKLLKMLKTLYKSLL